MLEYTKTILDKLSFDQSLFRKELEKSLNHLDPCEIINLKKWLEKHYYKSHFDTIHEIFYYQEDIA